MPPRSSGGAAGDRRIGRARHPHSQPVAARRRRGSAGAYKDVTAVVDAADRAGLSRKVARLEPLVCVKG